MKLDDGERRALAAISLAALIVMLLVLMVVFT